ncbi:MAG: hypothetical protein Q9178_001438 [Gyalolechia marmorata]
MSQSLGTSNGNNPRAGGYTALEYTRKPDHIPQTSQDEAEKYILALNTDSAHHKTVTGLRNKHFPANINKLSAHVALFRALPGSQLSAIQSAIERLVHHYEPFPISTGDPFLMAHGIGLGVHAEPAKHIYRILKEQWNGFLSKQDQSFKAHYTIQNKVENSIAQKSFDEVRDGPHRFEGSTGTVTGLSLYLYDRGYWRLKQTYLFEPRDGNVQKPVVEKNDSEAWPSLGASKSPKP